MLSPFCSSAELVSVVLETPVKKQQQRSLAVTCSWDWLNVWSFYDLDYNLKVSD